MMISSISARGIQAAAASFQKSAQRIVRVGVQESSDASEIPVTAVAGTREIGTASTAYAASEDIYIQEMTNMLLAEQTYKANISAYKTANEMADELVSLIKK